MVVIVTFPPAARSPSLSLLSAMAASVSSSPRPRSEAAVCSDAEAIQLENVVRRAHERPFTLHLLESTQQELPEAARLLDLADHGFDDAFAGGIDGRAGLRMQLARHAVDDRGVLRKGTVRTRPRPLAMFLLP